MKIHLLLAISSLIKKIAQKNKGSSLESFLIGNKNGKKIRMLKEVFTKPVTGHIQISPKMFRFFLFIDALSTRGEKPFYYLLH